MNPRARRPETGSPVISIVTPSYNQGRYVARTIESILNQDYRPIEHVIMDGGSTDDTLDVLPRYESSYDMRWYSEPDKGQSDAVNKALDLVTGEIIGWLNSDDLYVSTTALSAVAEAFAKNPDVGVVYGNVLEIDENDRIRRLRRNIPKMSKRLLVAFNFISQPAVFIRRSALANHRLDTDLDFVMDYELWLRLAQKEKFLHLDRFLAGVRYHSGAKNLTSQDRILGEAAEVRKSYSPGGIREAIDRLQCKALLRLYRMSAVMRIRHLSAESWSVPLTIESKIRVGLRQVPPFGWLEKRMAGRK